jgi:hypothetical protein
MRKATYLASFALALMVATPLLAQTGTVGVYYDAEGTLVSQTVDFDSFFDVYVVAFMEARVAGVSFALQMDPKLTVVATLYPENSFHIGDPNDGCGVDIALIDPAFGFFHTPMVFAQLQLYSGLEGLDMDTICVTNNCNYDTVVLADQDGVLFPGEGLCASMDGPVPADSQTWGQVKGMYR